MRRKYVIKTTILSMLLVFFFAANIEGAPLLSSQTPVAKICLLVQMDSTCRVKDDAPSAVVDVFKEKFKAPRFVAEENNKATQEFLVKMEDEKIFDPSSVNREVLAGIGEKFGYDYVALLNYSYGNSTYSEGFWSSKYKATVKLTAKVVNVQTKEYVYRQDVSVNGESSSAFGLPSFQSAVFSSMLNTTHKFCDELFFPAR